MNHKVHEVLKGLRVLRVHGVRGGTLALAILMAGGAVSAVSAQEPDRDIHKTTVWDGVFSEAQAARGRIRYDASCAACHRDGPRKEDAFMKDWSGSAVEGLFRQIKESMPAGAPSSLPDEAYLDIVAYMLQVNAFPASDRELTAAAINGIRIEGRNGPEPVPEFALIRAVGCLAQAPDSTWILAEASEPVRTRNPAASEDGELKSAGAAALGSRTFRLLNVFPSPGPYKGHKVEAKGFLIREPGDDRINTTSVQALAPGCDRAN